MGGEKHGNMVRAFDLLAGLPDDLEAAGREADRPQERKDLIAEDIIADLV